MHLHFIFTIKQKNSANKLKVKNKVSLSFWSFQQVEKEDPGLPLFLKSLRVNV